MNTNLFTNTYSPITVPVLRSNHLDITSLGLIIFFILISIQLLLMVYHLFKISYDKYKFRKYTKARENYYDRDSLKNLYFEVREKHNSMQLEFPFVKKIDADYIAAKYNLNENE